MLTDLLLGQGQATTPLRQPAFGVSLSSGASDSGGLGGLANAVADIVGAGAADPWQDYTSSISVECACAPFVDQAVVRLAPGTDTPQVVIDDQASIELGYGDSATVAVFSGQLKQLFELQNGERRLGFTNAGQMLSRQRANMTFQQATAADIVKQLLSIAAVDAGNIAAGEAKLPAYVVDDRISLYQHIARLAEWNGNIAFINAENKLDWMPLKAGQVVQTFSYGDDLIIVEKLETAPYSSGRRWQGEGAAASKGKNAWNWLSKKADANASGGEVEASRVFFQGAYRSREMVELAETGFTSLPPSQTTRLRLLASGAEAVKVGSTVAVSGTPQGKLDAEGVVIRLVHTLSKSAGFVTELELVTVAVGGSDSSLWGLL